MLRPWGLFHHALHTHLDSRKGRLPSTALNAVWWFLAMPVPKRLWVSYCLAPLAWAGEREGAREHSAAQHSRHGPQSVDE